MVQDPLDDLVIDEGSLAREELAEVLQPFVRFTRDGGLVLQPEFDGLAARVKVVCLLLSLRAMNLLGLRDRPGATPQELIELSGMAPGTVRPKLGELARVRLAGRDGPDYVVPVPAVRRAAAVVKEGGNE